MGGNSLMVLGGKLVRSAGSSKRSMTLTSIVGRQEVRESYLVARNATLTTVGGYVMVYIGHGSEFCTWCGQYLPRKPRERRGYFYCTDKCIADFEAYGHIVV